jgi:hypothetical protein
MKFVAARESPVLSPSKCIDDSTFGVHPTIRHAPP